MLYTNAFYRDCNEESRAFAKRFHARQGAMPTQFQAGVYSSLSNYLRAVQAAGTDEPQAVVAKLRETPIDDFFMKGGVLGAAPSTICTCSRSRRRRNR